MDGVSRDSSGTKNLKAKKNLKWRAGEGINLGKESMHYGETSVTTVSPFSHTVFHAFQVQYVKLSLRSVLFCRLHLSGNVHFKTCFRPLSCTPFPPRRGLE